VDTFGSNTLIRWVFLYGNNIFTFQSIDSENDTSKIQLAKWDKNLNLISKQTYPTLKGKDIRICRNFIIKDSVVITLGNYNNSNLYGVPFLAKFNLINLELLELKWFNESFFGRELLYNHQTGSFQVFASLYNKSSSCIVPSYDSTLQLLKTDTIPAITQFRPNYLPFRDSLFLVSGMGYSGPFPFRQLCLQVLDSNFKVVNTQLFFHFDSTDAWPADERSLVVNKNKEYFAAASLDPAFLCYTPDIGLLVVKLDSNLNTLWQRHIPGNRHDYTHKILETDDGGVIILATQSDTNSTWPYKYNARIIKLGPNGEITSVLNMGEQQVKGLMVFPNPANDVLNIYTGEGLQIAKAEIIDIQGKLICKTQICPQNTINISHLPVGFYLLRVITPKGEVMAVKFVKY
jgi:hypothetical protein